MIQLLFLVVLAESAVVFLMLVEIGPLKEVVMRSLDQVKMGRGPATAKTVAGTMAVILLSSFMNIVKIQNKGNKLGTLSPMDQVLWRTHLLEVLLMGFALFLGFLIDRMHHYLQKLVNLRSSAGSSKGEIKNLQDEKQQLRQKEEEASRELKQLHAEIHNLTKEIKKMKSESEEKDIKVETAEAHVAALQRQAEDLLLEYDRLLEDNQSLQQLQMSSRKQKLR